MRRSEKGRSMVEMLGVLAIIGVLSVGGIYGYTVAMRKYKANEVAQGAAMLATIARGSNAGTGLGSGSMTGAQAGLYDATNGNIQGCTLSATQNGDVVTVAVNCDTDTELKEAVKQLVGTGNDEFKIAS
ncbi:MAG: type II secretion system protein [Alphaproteobacteria bacterium]|nr:type II secretion system protein [Alphaproteobacteria bacterium]